MDDYMIVEQIQQHIRHDYDAIVAASIFGEQAWQWRGTGFARNGECLDVLVQGCRIPFPIGLTGSKAGGEEAEVPGARAPVVAIPKNFKHNIPICLSPSTGP